MILWFGKIGKIFLNDVWTEFGESTVCYSKVINYFSS